MTRPAKRRVPLIWSVLVALHLLLLALVLFTPIFRDTALEAFGITALVVPYLLHHLGLPVLESGGLSGAGWPTPNLLGGFISVVVWLAFYGGVAIGIDRVLRK